MHLLEGVARLLREDLHVLEREGVGERVRLVEVVDDDDLPPVAPCRLGVVLGGHAGQELLDVRQHLLAELARGGDEHRRRLGTVLCLREQVDGGEEGVGVVIGDDEDLGGSGEQIDADLAEELALGLGDVGVARSGDEVDRCDRLGADRHSGDGLHAAEHVDLVRAGELHGRDRRRGDLAADRRRARDDTRHAGDLRGDDRHVRRGGQRVLAAGDVGTRGLHGYVLLAEEHAGQRLDLDVDERVALGLREPAHLLLHEHDVVDDLLVQASP